MAPPTPEPGTGPTAAGSAAPVGGTPRIRRATALPMPDGTTVSPFVPAETPAGDDATRQAVAAALSGPQPTARNESRAHLPWRQNAAPDAEAASGAPVTGPGSVGRTRAAAVRAARIGHRPLLVAAAVAGAVIAATPLVAGGRNHMTNYAGSDTTNPTAALASNGGDSGGPHPDGYPSVMPQQNQQGGGTQSSTPPLLPFAPDRSGNQGDAGGTSGTAGTPGQPTVDPTTGTLYAPGGRLHVPGTSTVPGPVGTPLPGLDNGRDNGHSRVAGVPLIPDTADPVGKQRHASAVTDKHAGGAETTAKPAVARIVDPPVRKTTTTGTNTTGATTTGTTTSGTTTSGATTTGTTTGATARSGSTTTGTGDTGTGGTGTTGTGSTAATPQNTVKDKPQAKDEPQKQAPKKDTAPAPTTEEQWTSKTIHGTLVLAPGESAASNRMRLTMLTRGDLVVSDEHGTIRWSSHTSGSGNYATFQGDGNLVVYSRTSKALWSSHTAGNRCGTLVIQKDGNVVIKDANGRVRWAAATNH